MAGPATRSIRSSFLILVLLLFLLLICRPLRCSNPVNCRRRPHSRNQGCVPHPSHGPRGAVHAQRWRGDGRWLCVCNCLQRSHCARLAGTRHHKGRPFPDQPLQCGGWGGGRMHVHLWCVSPDLNLTKLICVSVRNCDSREVCVAVSECWNRQQYAPDSATCANTGVGRAHTDSVEAIAAAPNSTRVRGMGQPVGSCCCPVASCSVLTCVMHS
jgi:hypothetical protein